VKCFALRPLPSEGDFVVSSPFFYLYHTVLCYIGQVSAVPALPVSSLELRDIHSAPGGVVCGEPSVFPTTGGIPFIPIRDPYGEAGKLVFSAVACCSGSGYSSTKRMDEGLQCLTIYFASEGREQVFVVACQQR
jgi:hypothetical protein